MQKIVVHPRMLHRLRPDHNGSALRAWNRPCRIADHFPAAPESLSCHPCLKNIPTGLKLTLYTARYDIKEAPGSTTQRQNPDDNAAAPSWPPRHAATINHRVESLLVGLFAMAVGIMIFRAILNAADDTMLALLGPVLLFLLAASLFSGDRRRRP
jgi:hypothetical protein